MESLANDIKFMDFPSSLWGVHIEPTFKFIGILHINISQSTVSVDKGILLMDENNALKAQIFINGCISTSIVTTNIKVVADVSALLNTLQNMSFCINSSDSDKYPDCQKLIAELQKDKVYCNICRPDLDLGVFRTIYKFQEYEDVPYQSNSDLLEHSEDVACVNQEISSNIMEPNEKFEKRNVCEVSTVPKLNDDYLGDATENKVISEYTKNKEAENQKQQQLCIFCETIFTPGYNIDEHMLTHTQWTPYKCKICEKEFRRRYNLKIHEDTHSGTRSYVCGKCGKTYTTSSNLRTHTLSSHGGQKKCVCEICKRSFVYPLHLKIHMRKHNGEKPYMCSVCGKKFSKNIHLTVHTRIHTGEKPYRCNICEKSYITTGGLTYHQKKHHKYIDS